MKIFKRFISIGVVLILCICLCACGSDVDNLIGAWSGAWVYNGKQISSSFVLSENGQYTGTTLTNGKVSSSNVGTWEYADGELRLHPNGDLYSATVYEYKNGKLINNGHEHIKQGK